MVDPAHPPAQPPGKGPLGGACTFRDQTLPQTLPADPMPTVAAWLDEAARLKVQPNPNAMTLATAGPDGVPSARVVLCRGIDVARGYLVFYTNYRGRKGADLQANPNAALVFHWDDLDRQVRMEGLAARSPVSESDAYFASRPVMSRIAAWASEQSRPIAGRDALLRQNAEVEARFGVVRGKDGSPVLADGRPLESLHVPRPEHWGGYRLWARSVELWVGHTNRLHDRAVWERTLSPGTVDGVAGHVGGAWRVTRVQP